MTITKNLGKWGKEWEEVYVAARVVIMYWEEEVDAAGREVERLGLEHQSLSTYGCVFVY